MMSQEQPLVHPLELHSIPNARLMPFLQSKVTLIRTGTLWRITPEDINTLVKTYHLKTIFDLRSQDDIDKFKAEVIKIPGVDVQWLPLYKEGKGELYTYERTKSFFVALEQDEVTAWVDDYLKSVVDGAETIKKIVETVAKYERHPGGEEKESLLVHCNAGKDRTGVVTALLLMLANIPDGTIISDYALSEEALRPYLPLVRAGMSQSRAFQEHPEGGMKMMNAKPESMQAFLNGFREKYGCVQKYLSEVVGLSDEVIADAERVLGNKTF